MAFADIATKAIILNEFLNDEHVVVREYAMEGEGNPYRANDEDLEGWLEVEESCDLEENLTGCAASSMHAETALGRRVYYTSILIWWNLPTLPLRTQSCLVTEGGSDGVWDPDCH